MSQYESLHGVNLSAVSLKRSLNTDATVIVYNIQHVYLELLPTRTKLHVWGVC